MTLKEHYHLMKTATFSGNINLGKKVLFLDLSKVSRKSFIGVQKYLERYRNELDYIFLDKNTILVSKIEDYKTIVEIRYSNLLQELLEHRNIELKILNTIKIAALEYANPTSFKDACPEEFL